MKNTLYIPIVVVLVLLAGCQQPQSAQQLCNQASIALQKDDPARAASLLREATAMKPDFAEAWVALGMSLIQMNQNEEARSAYERALALHAQRYADTQSPNELQQQFFVLLLLNRQKEAEVLLVENKQSPQSEDLRRLLESDVDKWQIRKP